MMKDKFGFNFKCSKCGEFLYISDDNFNVKINSAYEFSMDMKIDPCRKCTQESQEVLRLLKNSISMIDKELNDD